MKNFLLCFLILFACKKKTVPQPKWEWKTLAVTASAYNSVPWQTTNTNPSIAAWGDTLKPGMKSIAISRDLLKLGLRHNTMVKIDTFSDTFYVMDKMNRKWRNRIDIYMGLDVKKARQWGKRKLQIQYAVPLDTTTTPKTN
ncbi:3D domain-containing protein [Flagellimonas sp. HMM57]|uniref:3D domain-containing protein n=1 Tax=unclassified Flagellimonas TaxID=2644544 RepID=UPI001F0A4F15|nr:MULTISPECIES: 3D domain-containing protein [unclassified Flagellimonas]UII75874.1 3D domain-containing protein [Flagellimonas sp. HMM57]